jgi:hypothetical protein
MTQLNQQILVKQRRRQPFRPLDGDNRVIIVQILFIAKRVKIGGAVETVKVEMIQCDFPAIGRSTRVFSSQRKRRTLHVLFDLEPTGDTLNERRLSGSDLSHE